MMDKRGIQALAISGIFFVFQFVLVHFHEPWADEIHAWEITRCSHSLGELFYITRYEGHPKLWFIMLYFLQKVTTSYVAMQYLHVFIAACAVFVFCFFSPFSTIKNILFCAGYFFSYEYSIISRNYTIEVLLLFWAAGIYTKYGDKRLWLLSLLFFLLYQTNVFAIIIGAPFWGYVLLNSLNKKNYKSFIGPSVIVLAGIIFSTITTLPPPDNFTAPWNTYFDVHNLAKVISTGYTAYIPIPRVSNKFWYYNLLDALPHHIIIEDFLTLALLFLVTVLFRNNKKLLLLFYAGTIGEWLFFYFKYFGYIRHHGHLFLLFALCYWLYSSQSKIRQGTTMWYRMGKWVNKYAITTILISQVLASCVANIFDVFYPFSNSEPVAKYIKSQSLDKLPLLGDGDFSAAGIAGILHEDIYYMRPAKWGKYILPDQNWGPFIKFGQARLLTEANKIMTEKKSDVIVILSYPFKDTNLDNWKLLKTFGGSIDEEDYYVYKVGYTPQDAASLNNIAELLIAKGRFEDAIKVLYSALGQNPHYGVAYMNLADCFNNGMHDYTKALSMVDSAIKYSPQDYRMPFNKGAILFNMGERKKGIDEFKEAAKLAQQKGQVYATISQCYQVMGDSENAKLYRAKAAN